MSEELDSGGNPNYRHFKQESDSEAQQRPEEGEQKQEQAQDDSTQVHDEIDELKGDGPLSPERDKTDHAQEQSGDTDSGTSVKSQEGNAQPKRTTATFKERLLKLVRLCGIGVLLYVAATLAFFIIVLIGTSVDYGGTFMRFGLAGTMIMVLFAPAALVIAIALAILLLFGKIDIQKLTKTRVAIAGSVCAVLILGVTAGFTGSPLTCLHVETTPATCTKPETCAECGAALGDALGHDWIPATCTELETCRRCGLTRGSLIPHIAGEWTVTAEATCTAEGSETSTCIVCGAPMTQTIPKIPHAPGEMVTVQEPSVSYETGQRVDVPGKREQTCTVCGAVIASEEIQPTEEQATEAFKAACATFSYDQAARDPDSLNGNLSTFSGRVVQVMQQDNIYVLRVNKDNDYDCTIYVIYMAEEGAPRILEDDNITLWGTLNGLETYTTIFGASVTIPSFVAIYIE